MPVIIIFIIMMIWWWCIFNVIRNMGVALAMGVVGVLVPMGLLAAFLNLAWYLYKHKKGETNPLVS